jgi:hypothetical protein
MKVGRIEVGRCTHESREDRGREVYSSLPLKYAT